MQAEAIVSQSQQLYGPGRRALWRSRLAEGRKRRFQTTRWSLVIRAGSGDGQQALSELCRAYWHPVHDFFRSQGVREEDAGDLTQGLFADLLRRHDFRKVDRTRGRFRNWLCACAKHHLYNFRKHKAHQLPAADTSQEHPSLECSELRTPDALFDRRWALTVIARSVARLREHYAEVGQRDVFLSLEGRLSGEGSEAPDSVLSILLGKAETAVRAQRSHMKDGLERRFTRYLRAEIGETVAGPEAIDDEIRQLLLALG